MSCAATIQSSSGGAPPPGLGTTSCGSRQPCAVMNETTEGCVCWPSPAPPHSGARWDASAKRDGALTSHEPLSRSGVADLASSARNPSRRDSSVVPTPSEMGAIGSDPSAREGSPVAAASPRATAHATSAVTNAPRNIVNPVTRAMHTSSSRGRQCSIRARDGFLPSRSVGLFG